MTATIGPLFTPEQLAELFGLDSDITIRRRCASGEFPHLRIHRNAIRFTEEHVAEIIRMVEVTVEQPAPEPRQPRPNRPTVPGLTRSRRSEAYHSRS